MQRLFFLAVLALAIVLVTADDTSVLSADQQAAANAERKKLIQEQLKQKFTHVLPKQPVFNTDKKKSAYSAPSKPTIAVAGMVLALRDKVQRAAGYKFKTYNPVSFVEKKTKLGITYVVKIQINNTKFINVRVF